MTPVIHSGSVFQNATPAKLYEFLMNSAKHTAATGMPAKISLKVGGKWSAFGGMIRGKNLVLIPNKMIVQTWRSSEWKKADPDSILIVSFDKSSGGGAQVDLVHVGVPDYDQRSGKGNRLLGDQHAAIGNTAVQYDGSGIGASAPLELNPFGHGGKGLTPPEHGDRNDGRLRLQRQANEPAPEVDQRVAVAKQLGRTACSLGKHHEQAVLVQQALGVLGQPGELTGARGPEVHEGDAVHELLDHPLRQARRVHLQQAGGDDHGAVDGDPAGVVADQHGSSTGGDVLDAGGLHAEVVTVERGDGGQPDAQVLPRDAEGIQPESVERKRQAVDAIADFLVDAKIQAGRG